MCDFSNYHTWLNLFLTLTLMIGVVIVMYFVNKRKIVYYFYGGAILVFILSFIFEISVLMWFDLILFVAGSILFMLVNLSEIRPLLANPLKGKVQWSKKTKIEKVYDREALFHVVDNTVSYLSKNKIGAIMTFERKVPLVDVVRSGSMIDAPVTMELLITIFYPGTRLHDGAVIIHGDRIVAASVYFTPTTKPLTGKYGSRHRAAIGISETTDSVTVVVSEETGRVSIAYNGELESVPPDSFLRIFENYMNQDEKDM